MNFRLVLESVIETLFGPLKRTFLIKNAREFYFLGYILLNIDQNRFSSGNFRLVLKSVIEHAFLGGLEGSPPLQARNVTCKKSVLFHLPTLSRE